MKELQDRWIDNQLIGLDIIYHHSGIVKNIDIDFIKNDKLIHTFQKEYSLSYEGETTLTELFGNYDDPWSEIQVNNKVLLNNDQIVLCGEGEMGNEGFIVKTDTNNNIKWFLYSTTSNPFVNIKQKDNMVYIQSTSNFYAVLNLSNDDVFLLNEDIFTLREG
ncbi:hypothetical protein ID855_18070 [Xenorhabdus sp. ZM]|nr:hypothetical protein [Xenorhabdus sp. 38]MBD2806560.1 hypothetical protein [Xenorhabdus sp. ZM]